MVRCCLTVLLALTLTACVIPTPAELEAAAAETEDVAQEETPDPLVELEPVEEVEESEPEGSPLFGAQELVDLKDANPVRFNRDWDGKEVMVVGILADIDFSGDHIRLIVNESGIDYIIGVNCRLERSAASDAAVAEFDRGIEIQVAGLVVARDDWLLELEPCGVVEAGSLTEASS